MVACTHSASTQEAGAERLQGQGQTRLCTQLHGIVRGYPQVHSQTLSQGKKEKQEHLIVSKDRNVPQDCHSPFGHLLESMVNWEVFHY